MQHSSKVVGRLRGWSGRGRLHAWHVLRLLWRRRGVLPAYTSLAGCPRWTVRLCCWPWQPAPCSPSYARSGAHWQGETLAFQAFAPLHFTNEVNIMVKQKVLKLHSHNTNFQLWKTWLPQERLGGRSLGQVWNFLFWTEVLSERGQQ